MAPSCSDKDMKMYIQQLKKYVTGLHAILISDRDGVPIIKGSVLYPKFRSILGEKGPVRLFICQIEGGESSIITSVIQLNEYPLVVTFIADAQANTGEILNLQLDLKQVLKDIKTTLGSQIVQTPPIVVQVTSKQIYEHQVSRVSEKETYQELENDAED